MKNTSMYIPTSEEALLQPNAAGMLESQAREATPHSAEATTKLPAPMEGGAVIQEQNPHQPRVWDCHAGKEYPTDAVYVGCRTIHPFKGNVIREGTIFGNGTNPLVSHDGSLPSEREFRA